MNEPLIDKDTWGRNKPVSAPWTKEQVECLKLRQQDNLFHPYTCLYCSTDLEPRTIGWWCKKCKRIVQDWAHGTDTTWAPADYRNESPF